MLKRYLLNPGRTVGADDVFCDDNDNDNSKSWYQNEETTYIPKRAAPFAPYSGYSIDEYKIKHDDIRGIETKTLIRNLTYKEHLALRLKDRHIQNHIRRIFMVWKRHSFRYVFLRSQLMKCHMMRFLSRRFQGWRLVARREAVLRICIKHYWRRHRYLRYIRWKLDTRWRVMKEKSLKFGFKHMLIHLAYQRRINMRWQRIKSMYQRIVSALVLQRGQRRHSARRHYWAIRTIKRFFMCLYGIRLVEERKRMERQRITLEIETSDILVERGLTYLKNLLQEDNGRELHSLYLKAIKVILKKTNETIGDIQPMFPHRREMPGIGAMWTTNGKAMYILKHRCEVEIRKLARDKFRLVSPPLYECRHCHCVCFLGCEIRHHRKYCQYNEDVDDQPNYVAWRLAEPVVEGALAPLKKHYGKQKNHLRNMQTKSNLQYLKSLQSFHWEKTPAKPLKFARSKSYKGISSIKLSKLPSREAGGISRASSIRSGITFNGALSPTPRPRGSSASDNNKFMNNSFYGSVQSVSDHDEEETAAGMSTSRSAIMKQHGAKLLTSGGSKAPPGVMGLSGKTYAKGSLSSPSMYRLKSQKLLANAIFSDGSTTKVQDRYHEDLFDDDEPEDGQETTNHDENVDDWY